ncbi:carnitine/acyl carnitine carrier [Russula ochroleuca]|uniref:Carnitine/acyl carnitine carrier n=1 Tax=Russula ochroleuca TaxID=152965 RepID=A0A9P5JYR1_9AGAM|nr:carnitine/acyl carnitine carrier [Russula ochroleuca]
MSTSVSPGNGNDKLDATLDPTLDFLAGTAAGISGLVVGFPFDTVKYRFQNPSPNARYRSTFHALVTITREERLHGLFKGISSPLATAPVMNGMLFATYHFFTKLQMRHDNDDAQDQQPTLGQIFLAGSYCGLASTLLTTPIELIKIQQQKQQQQQHLETGRASPASARAVALHVYRAGGIRALYHGLSATIWRDVGGFGLYFYGYEGTLRFFAPAHPAHHSDSIGPVLDEVVGTPSRPWVPLIAGAAAGVLGWIATFPFDVLKTRLQAVTISTGTGTDADATLGTSWRTARKMYAESGGRVFWRGLVPTLVRAIPVNMAVFGTFEGVVWTFSRT